MRYSGERWVGEGKAFKFEETTLQRLCGWRVWEFTECRMEKVLREMRMENKVVSRMRTVSLKGFNKVGHGGDKSGFLFQKIILVTT